MVAQSGGPTAVINASVAGVVSEALNQECIEEIYGGMNGVLGILKEDLIDLAEESQQNIRGLATPLLPHLELAALNLSPIRNMSASSKFLRLITFDTFFTAEGMTPRILLIKFPSLRRVKVMHCGLLVYPRLLTMTLSPLTTARVMAAW